MKFRGFNIILQTCFSIINQTYLQDALREEVTTRALLALEKLVRAQQFKDLLFSKLIQLAFLAPYIVDAALNGSGPISLIADQLGRLSELPICCRRSATFFLTVETSTSLLSLNTGISLY